MRIKKPLFSIITVCYNAEKTIERTLQSVVEQTYNNYEFIVIDGSSKDSTLDLIQLYKKKVDKLISEPDNGLYEAMNKGMNLAQGEYLCYLNAGDTFYSSNTLKQIATQVERNTSLPDVIYGHTAIVDNQGCYVRMRRLTPPTDLNWKCFKQGMLVCHQAFYPKRVLSPQYDLKYRYSADFDWCIRILKRSNHTQYIQPTLVNYLDEGLTTQNHKKSLLERFKIMVKHYGLLSTICHHFWFILRYFNKR